MAQLIDGKSISTQIKEELREKVAAMKAEGKTSCLAVIQVGKDPASSVYVNNKKKACAFIGIESLSYELPDETTENELLELIQKLNSNEKVNGILVQLPLPKHIDDSPKGCGWISSYECWGTLYREARLCILYSGRNYPAFKTFQYRNRRQRMCHHWKKQYCRKTNGNASSP